MRALAYSGAKGTWPMTFKNCHYKKRDYLTPSRKKVVAKFPFLFANLNVPQ